MLWRALYFRTLQSTISLKKEPSYEKFTVSKRNFNSHSRLFQCPDSRKTQNFEKRRFVSTDSTGLSIFSKALAKFSPENISKHTGLPTVEELTKYLSLDHCLPVEVVQNGFLYLNSTCGLPWWGVIAMSALSTRLLLLPLAILAERKNAQINNNIPRVKFLQCLLDEARKMKDNTKSARIAQEMSLFQNHRQITWSLLNSSIVTLVQAPLFIIFLTAIKSMPQTQLQSMRQGGLYWFTDLTAIDPKFLLPILTTLTLSAVVELTLHSSKYVTDNRTMIYTLRAHPFIILPFIANFSSAFLLYWTCYNIIAIVEASVFRIPTVRNFFKIEKIFSFIPSALNVKNPVLIRKSKSENLNKKVYEELELKQRLHRMRYSKARKGLSGRVSSDLDIRNVQQIPQRLKLKAIMESTRSKFS